MHCAMRRQWRRVPVRRLARSGARAEEWGPKRAELSLGCGDRVELPPLAEQLTTLSRCGQPPPAVALPMPAKSGAVRQLLGAQIPAPLLLLLPVCTPPSPLQMPSTAVAARCCSALRLTLLPPLLQQKKWVLPVKG